MTATPSFSDIKSAQARILPALVRTPTRHSRTLSGIAGCDVWLKFENRQFTASFKERGALNRILALSDEERRRGVAAMSAGNHAQEQQPCRRQPRLAHPDRFHLVGNLRRRVRVEIEYRHVCPHARSADGIVAECRRVRSGNGNPC